mgnify:CR=1 FL=1
MKTWRIVLVNAPGGETKKALEEVVMTAYLQAIRATEPEAWRDLLRLLQKVML